MKKLTQFFPVLGHKKSTQGDSGKMILESEREGSQSVSASQKSENHTQNKIQSFDRTVNPKGRDSKEENHKSSQ